MPFLLLRNFPNDFVPDQRALWCLFGSIMNISGKEDKEDVPFSSYVPKRPPALPRWRLLSVFWGKQLSRGWFAVCQVEKFASTQNDNASSSSSDNDDDEEESSNINNKFPELWIGNKQLEVLALSDKIAQSTIGMVDVTATAKEMMHKERDMKRSMKSGTGNDNNNSMSGGGNNKKFDSSSSATRRSRQDGDDGGKPKKKKIQFALGDNDDNNKKSHEDENHNHVNDSGIPDHTTDAAEVSTQQQTAAVTTNKKSNKHVFGKDCCQICGSKAHFTRKCPHKSKSGDELEKVIAENNTGGVGVAISSKSEEEQEDTRSSVHKKETTTAAVSPAAASALPPTEKKKQQQHNFGPDCCQKCGDKSHFTRKCPHKNKSAEELEKVISGEKSGAVAAVSSSTSSAPAVAEEEEKSVKKQKKKSASPAKEQQQELPQAYKKSPEQKPAAVVKKPVPKFTDPDACKFCGAKDHFSRKCPNKNKQ